MRQRIADDPDSWGKPEDLVKKVSGTCPYCNVAEGHDQRCDRPAVADPSAMTTCQKCGVMWHYHDSSVCGGSNDDGAYAGMLAWLIAEGWRPEYALDCVLRIRRQSS